MSRIYVRTIKRIENMHSPRLSGLCEEILDFMNDMSIKNAEDITYYCNIFSKDIMKLANINTCNVEVLEPISEELYHCKLFIYNINNFVKELQDWIFSEYRIPDSIRRY